MRGKAEELTVLSAESGMRSFLTSDFTDFADFRMGLRIAAGAGQGFLGGEVFTEGREGNEVGAETK